MLFRCKGILMLFIVVNSGGSVPWKVTATFLAWTAEPF
jgi:hypothetical protein